MRDRTTATTANHPMATHTWCQLTHAIVDIVTANFFMTMT